MEPKQLIYISIAVLVTVFTVSSAEELDNKVVDMLLGRTGAYGNNYNRDDLYRLALLQEALQDEPTLASAEDLEESLEPYYNDFNGYDELDKRGSMFRFGKRGALFRFGKRGNVFRYGKRGGSLFRFGKRGGSLFRFGKREDDNTEEEKRKSMFRYGRGDMMDEEKRKSMFRYGKRFVRDTKRQKVHTPFRFGREEDEQE